MHKYALGMVYPLYGVWDEWGAQAVSRYSGSHILSRLRSAHCHLEGPLVGHGDYQKNDQQAGRGARISGIEDR